MYHFHWYARLFPVCCFGWQCIKTTTTEKNPTKYQPQKTKPRQEKPPKACVNATVPLVCLSSSLILGTSVFSSFDLLFFCAADQPREKTIISAFTSFPFWMESTDHLCCLYSAVISARIIIWLGHDLCCVPSFSIRARTGTTFTHIDTMHSRIPLLFRLCSYTFSISVHAITLIWIGYRHKSHAAHTPHIASWLVTMH